MVRGAFIVIAGILISCTARAQQLRKYTFPHPAKIEMGTFSPTGTTGVKNEQLIPQNFYTTDLGFFCKQELKLQQAHVPLIFRLGDIRYCNYLEQKPGYRYLDAN